MNERAPSASLRRRFQIEWLIVALTASAIVAAAALLHWTRPVDDLLYDAAMQATPAQADPGLLIIAIDEPSLGVLGRWPWPRDLHAQALDALAAARPQSVTLDVLMTEPGVAADDARLARAMAAIERIYLPVQFVVPGRDGRTADRLPPAPVLAGAADGLGHVNTRIDTDGNVRSAALCFAADRADKPVPHLMTLVTGTALATGCQNPRRLRFAPPAAFSTISFASLVRGEVPPALITGRHVLIGMTAQGLGDRYPVPSSAGGNMPGVEINANIANALVHGLWVREPGIAVRLVLALLPGWLVLAAVWRIRPRHVVLLVAALIVLVLAGSAGGLLANIWVPPGPALMGLVLIYPFWGWRRLQATSDYMAEELGRLEREEALPIGDVRPIAADLVTGQSRQLRHAISQLRDLRRFVSDSLAGLPDPALVSDTDGTIMLANAAADTAFGPSLAGRGVDEVLAQIAEPSRLATLRTYLAQPGDAHIEFETTTGRCFALRRAPIIDSSGAMRGHADYFTDITAIVTARREREEMLQLLSHDMRAPQAAILAMLSSDVPDLDRARLARHARHTLTLADNFVDLARMQERAFDPDAVIAVDIASEAADSLWPVASQRNVRIAVTDNSDCAFILAERESLFRALVNLIDNAVKYSPDGGRVTVALDVTNADRLAITIADQGKGIDPAILPRLFQRFASSSDGHAAVKGIGLGLAYVAAVIDRHGGTIAGSNGVEGGAVFVITLPVES